MIEKNTSNTTENTLKNKRGLEAFHSKLVASLESKEPGVIGVDLDDTTKENHDVRWSDGNEYKVYPETVAAFMALAEAKISVTPITEQSLSEIAGWKKQVENLAGNSKLFTGIIAEGGCVAMRGVGPRTGEVSTITPQEQVEHSRRVLSWLHENLVPATDEELKKEGWCVLQGTDPLESAYVMLPSDQEQGLASVTLWKKGPRVSEDASYVERYAIIDNHIQKAMEEGLGIKDLIAREAGNGTTRISPRNIDKAKTMMLLASQDAYDPSRMGYFCDGPNDISFAEQLKSKGGFVITVENGVSRLKEISDYTATQKAGKGFAEVVEKLFPNEFKKAFEDLKNRGLYQVS
jgi:3-deoxy-D-manno-octulosonate 8-phosphate phosphatase KdsC-like HAD superfamily phosphatase